MKIKFELKGKVVKGIVEGKTFIALAHKFACIFGKDTKMTMTFDDEQIIIHNDDKELGVFTKVDAELYDAAAQLFVTVDQMPGMEVLLQDGRWQRLAEQLQKKEDISVKGDNSQQLAEMIIWANICATVWVELKDLKPMIVERAAIYLKAQAHAWGNHKRSFPNAADIEFAQQKMTAQMEEQQAQEDYKPLTDKLYMKLSEHLGVIARTCTNFDTRCMRDENYHLSWANGLTLINYKKWLSVKFQLVPASPKGTREATLRNEMRQMMEVVNGMLVAKSMWEPEDHMDLLDLAKGLREVRDWKVGRPNATKRQKVITAVGGIARTAWEYTKFLAKVAIRKTIQLAKSIWSGLKAAWNGLVSGIKFLWDWAFAPKPEVIVTSEEGQPAVAVA